MVQAQKFNYIAFDQSNMQAESPLMMRKVNTIPDADSILAHDENTRARNNSNSKRAAESLAATEFAIDSTKQTTAEMREFERKFDAQIKQMTHNMLK